MIESELGEWEIVGALGGLGCRYTIRRERPRGGGRSQPCNDLTIQTRISHMCSIQRRMETKRCL